jgi:hypothetical protein
VQKNTAALATRKVAVRLVLPTALADTLANTPTASGTSDPAGGGTPTAAAAASGAGTWGTAPAKLVAGKYAYDYRTPRAEAHAGSAVHSALLALIDAAVSARLADEGDLEVCTAAARVRAHAAARSHAHASHCMSHPSHCSAMPVAARRPYRHACATFRPRLTVATRALTVPVAHGIASERARDGSVPPMLSAQSSFACARVQAAASDVTVQVVLLTEAASGGSTGARAAAGKVTRSTDGGKDTEKVLAVGRWSLLELLESGKDLAAAAPLPLWQSEAVAQAPSDEARALAAAAATAAAAAAAASGAGSSAAAAAATTAIGRAEKAGQLGTLTVTTSMVRALLVAQRQLKARRAHAVRRAAPQVPPAACAAAADAVAGGGAGGVAGGGGGGGVGCAYSAAPLASSPSFPCISSSGPSVGVGVGMGSAVLEGYHIRQAGEAAGVVASAAGMRAAVGPCTQPTPSQPSYRVRAVSSGQSERVAASAMPTTFPSPPLMPAFAPPPTSAVAYQPPPADWGVESTGVAPRRSRAGASVVGELEDDDTERGW